MIAVAIATLLGACGGGGSSASPQPPTNGDGGSSTRPGDGGTGPTTGDGTPITPDPPSPAYVRASAATLAALGLTACEPSGVGRDFVVGDGTGQIRSLDQVPWESLGAGDTVRIAYRSPPYHGKILIAAQGTAQAPVRICGIRGPNGERPIIDGTDAVARAGLAYTAAALDHIQETRSVVMIDRLATQDWGTARPAYVQLDGLEIRGATPDRGFTNSAGRRQSYVDFGACVWIERGHRVVIADNEIHDCTQGVFSRSTPDGDFSVTRDVRLVANAIHGNGLPGVDTLHNTYLQSIGVRVEFNRFGPLRAGARGNAIKDRSVGTIVRYNRIEQGAHAIDLVEAEDYATIATADPAYRTAFVYGNQIIKNGETGSFIHYGGDHYDCCEANFRRGTLYVFHNTVIATGGDARLFQLSTTLETARVWNNVFAFASTVAYPSMRSGSETGTGYVSGGTVVLGRNWLTAGWADSDPYHPVDGTLSGAGQAVTGTAWPIDAATFVPLAGSAIIDAAQPAPADAVLGEHADVAWQLDADGLPQARRVNGARADLGAVER